MVTLGLSRPAGWNKVWMLVLPATLFHATFCGTKSLRSSPLGVSQGILTHNTNQLPKHNICKMPGSKRKYGGTDLVQFAQAKKRASFMGAKVVARQSVQSLVRKVLTGVAEKKELTTFGSINPISNGGNVANLNTITQGTTIANRVGNSIKMSSFYSDIVVQNPGSGAYDNLLVALVCDKQPDGSATTFTTIFDCTAGNSPAQAFKLTTSNALRFHVAWQERVLFNSTTAAENTIFRKYFKCPDSMATTQYNGNAGIANTGVWYLCFGSFNNAGTATSPQVTYNVKAKFTDV